MLRVKKESFEYRGVPTDAIPRSHTCTVGDKRYSGTQTILIEEITYNCDDVNATVGTEYDYSVTREELHLTDSDGRTRRTCQHVSCDAASSYTGIGENYNTHMIANAKYTRSKRTEHRAQPRPRRS